MPPSKTPEAAHTERASWLPGFAWALPAAFAGAVSSCRFEQGDVLHEGEGGYGDWAEGAPGRWLQVLDPPRSARAVAGGGDAGRFVAQWGSPVELDLADAPDAQPRRLVTTQGRLFTCLWHGELGALEQSNAPPPPILLADLQRSLEPTLAGLRARLVKTKRRSKADAAAMLFVAALDWSSDASIAKADAIATALAAHFAISIHDAAPGDVGVPDAQHHLPTLCVRGIRIEAADEQRVSDALKAVLYTPGAKTRSEDDDDAAVASDRFSVARHGLLVPFVEIDADA